MASKVPGGLLLKHSTACLPFFADIAALMDYGGLSLAEACERVVMEKLPALGGSGGLIAIDHEGNVALPFNTEGMYRAWGYAGDTPTTGIYRERGDTVATQ